MNRIASLDGLRGISILAVLFGHGWQVSGYPKVLIPLSWGADLGVHCFFVLSGYLITSLLLQEYNKYGKISLSKFYKKRALRLLPTYYLFVFVVAILHATPFQLSLQGWIGILTFTANVYPGNNTTAHLWSLAVEQQFYLLWPPLFLLFAYFSKNNFHQYLLQFLSIVLIICPISRYYQNPWPQAGWLGHYSFLNQVDLLAYGCILSFVSYRYPKKFEALIENNRIKWVLIAALIILAPKALAMKDFWPIFLQSFRISLSGIGFAAIIAWIIKYNDLPICNIFKSGIFAKIGIISYSVYIWHMLIWTSPREFGMSWAPWGNFFVYFIMSLIVGWISWNIVERPYFSKKYSQLNK